MFYFFKNKLIPRDVQRNMIPLFPNNFSHRNQFLNQLNSNNYYNNNNNEFMNRARIVHNKIKRKRPVSAKKLQ